MFNGLLSRTTWVSRHQKGKPFWILLKRKMMGGSGISWIICKSFAPHFRQITTPVSHHSVFYGPDALPDAQPMVSKHCRQTTVPTAWIYSIQFEFWCPELHQHLCLHSALVHPVPVTGFTQPLQINHFITLCMLPLIALHFLCTHFLQLVHYWIIANTSATDTT